MEAEGDKIAVGGENESDWPLCWVKTYRASLQSGDNHIASSIDAPEVLDIRVELRGRGAVSRPDGPSSMTKPIFHRVVPTYTGKTQQHKKHTRGV